MLTMPSKYVRLTAKLAFHFILGCEHIANPLALNGTTGKHLGSEKQIRTADEQVMSLTCYHYNISLLIGLHRMI
jgi:hypothetical protein